MIRLINALLAIVGGVGAALLLYWILNKLVEMLPTTWEERLKPWVFIGPAVAAIGLFLVYPAIRTFILSFANAQSTAWVGFENYSDLLGSEAFRQTLYNTLLWIAVVPAVTVALGLGVAVLADRLGPQSEKLSKSIIFLLMTILIWAQVGFSMVLLSAAVKGVPVDTLEAARIDGANERQIFFRVIVPQIWATVITVFITVLISVMKIFDVVYVMTNGNFNTDVIAVNFFNELFRNGNNGRASAIVVMLMIAVLPVIIYQVRHFRAEEAAR